MGGRLYLDTISPEHCFNPRGVMVSVVGYLSKERLVLTVPKT